MCEGFYAPAIKVLRITVLTILYSVFLPCPIWSQKNDIYSSLPLAEKIYLQLDGKAYTTDKTIWFKSIVVNADDHAPTKLSGVLYVELIGPDEKIIEKKVIKLENGIGDGFFDLNQNYPEGLYLIRAYTKWDENFGTDFFFKEYIQVFVPYLKDSLHKKDLTIFITLDDKKDSLVIKKNDDNKYMIDYTIPDECQFVPLQMQTKNLSRYS